MDEQVPEDAFFLDRAAAASLQAQLREAVVSGVLTGRMPAGARLPSTRRLAQHLGVSRITVTLAYQELVAQGYLATEVRSAYVVSAAAPRPRVRRGAAAILGPPPDWSARLTSELATRRRIEKPADWRSYPYPFIYGQMDMGLFDHGAWRDCARRALGRRDFEVVAGDAYGADDPELVDYIRRRTLPRRGVEAEADEILITLGAQHALWLAIRLLTRRPCRAVFEEPGHPDIAAALRWNGAELTLLPVDEGGLPVERLPDAPDLVVVTPSHHAPTAATMPMARRLALLEAASARDFLIIEDDYDFEMSFLGPPSPALKSLDRAGRVLYVGSFSKALFPGLRLGYLVAPPPFAAEARRLRALMLRDPPGQMQRTVAHFLALGHYDALVRRMRQAFAERREVATRALEAADFVIAGAARFGGANLWVRAPGGVDSALLAERLLPKGVVIEPGAPFFDRLEGGTPFFRLAYSSISASRIAEGVRRIADCAARLAEG